MLKPNGDKVLVRMIRKDRTKSGLWIPDGAKIDTCWMGEVIAKGKGPNADYITVGKTVIIEKMYAMKGSMEGLGQAAIDCSENDIDGKDCLLMDACQILGEVE